MRPKLLASTVTVVTFWFLVTTLYWSFQKPEVNYQALLSLAAFAQNIGLGGWVSSMNFDANLFASLAVQKAVLLRWTLPILVLTAISGGIGYGITWWMARKSDAERTQREKGTGKFRGVTLTVGVLPQPRRWPRDDVELSAEDNEALAALNEKEAQVLNQIMGTISANEEKATPPTGETSLVEYTLKRLSMFFVNASQEPIEHFGLTTLAVAAVQLGYLNAYAKGPGAGTWVPNGNKTHAGEAGAILTGLPAWDELPMLEKQALYLCVKYNMDAQRVPDLQGDTTIAPIARLLIHQSAAYCAMPASVPVKLVPEAKPEKVVSLEQFQGPSELAQEDAAYVLPGQAAEDEGATAPAPDANDSRAPLGMIPQGTSAAPAPANAAEPDGDTPPWEEAPAPAAAPVPAPVAPPAAPATPAAPAPAKPATPVAAPKPAAPVAPKAPAVAAAPSKPRMPGAATAATSEAAMWDADCEKAVLDTFIRIMPTLAFQDRGLPKAVKAVAWKVEHRVFMLEIQLREKVFEALPEHIRDKVKVLQKAPKVRVQPLTSMLLHIFDAKGWLVKEINEVNVSPKEALWNIVAGTKAFNGVIVLDLPEDIRPLLPARDSMYTVKVEGPLFLSSSTGHKRPEGGGEGGHRPPGGGGAKRPTNQVVTPKPISLAGILG